MNRNRNSAAPQQQARGFSLIEALIAAAIFAYMMLGTVPLLLKSVTDTARNRNQMHYNLYSQALVDELTGRQWVRATGDSALSTGWHVFSNNSTYVNNATTPTIIPEMFAGSLSNSGDRTQQNSMLGQVQYQVSTEFGRVRVDVQIFYFTRGARARSMTGLCSGTSGVNSPVKSSCDPAAPPAGMAVLASSSYIDLPIR